MNKQTIRHHIPKTKEGTYYTLPFPVPQGMEAIKVSYSYTRLSGKVGRPSSIINVVDLGLLDEKGSFLGWSGSARSSVTVGKYTSTNGYLMTDINPGQWKIIIGAYKIPNHGLDVEYEIEFIPPKPRWFTGDLHMHSTASDGQHDIYTLTRKARKLNLDFIAVSNHNNYSENLHLPIVPGLTLLPAVEWTHYLGHMNFFGVKTPFENSFTANSEEEMRNLIADARDKGALISVNHPKCHLCPYLWKSEDTFDLVEVWNGPMGKRNKRAIAWWHSMLSSGCKIPLVGGSDFHKDKHPVRFGHPVIRIYAPTPSEHDLLQGIAKGHSYVVDSLKGVSLDMSCGNAIMGDTIKLSGEEDLIIKAKGLSPSMEVQLVTEKGISQRWTTFEKGELYQKIKIDPGWEFGYMKVFKKLFFKEILHAISNPVYFDRE